MSDLSTFEIARWPAKTPIGSVVFAADAERSESFDNAEETGLPYEAHWCRSDQDDPICRSIPTIRSPLIDPDGPAGNLCCYGRAVPS